MERPPVQLNKNQRSQNDLYADVKAWLKARHLSASEFQHLGHMLQLRLLVLDKVDEAHYLERYIKLRTR